MKRALFGSIRNVQGFQKHTHPTIRLDKVRPSLSSTRGRAFSARGKQGPGAVETNWTWVPPSDESSDRLVALAKARLDKKSLDTEMPLSDAEIERLEAWTETNLDVERSTPIAGGSFETLPLTMLTSSEIAGVLEAYVMKDVRVYDMSKLPHQCEMIIATGRSTRHLRRMVGMLVRAMKDRGFARRFPPWMVQGVHSDGSWIVVDFENVMVHLMLESERIDKDLETLWVRQIEKFDLLYDVDNGGVEYVDDRRELFVDGGSVSDEMLQIQRELIALDLEELNAEPVSDSEDWEDSDDSDSSGDDDDEVKKA